MPSLAGKCKQVLMVAVPALYTGKAVMKNPAVQILIDYFFYMGSQVSIFFIKISLIGSLEFLVAIFDALVVRTVLGFSSSIL